MSKFKDIECFDFLDLSGKSEDYIQGVQDILEAIDALPTYVRSEEIENEHDADNIQSEAHRLLEETLAPGGPFEKYREDLKKEVDKSTYEKLHDMTYNQPYTEFYENEAIVSNKIDKEILDELNVIYSKIESIRYKIYSKYNIKTRR